MRNAQMEEMMEDMESRERDGGDEAVSDISSRSSGSSSSASASMESGPGQGDTEVLDCEDDSGMVMESSLAVNVNMNVNVAHVAHVSNVSAVSPRANANLGLRTSSALSRASDGSAPEPVARLISENRTWAHRNRPSNQAYHLPRNSRPSWSHREVGSADNPHGLFSGGQNRQSSSYGHAPRSINSQDSSSFSPLSYANDNGQIESLSQLQNEALGSWLRLRPREHPHLPQAYRRTSYLSQHQYRSTFQQDPYHGQIRYPVTMVANDELDASNRFLSEIEYQTYMRREEQMRVEQIREEELEMYRVQNQDIENRNKAYDDAATHEAIQYQTVNDKDNNKETQDVNTPEGEMDIENSAFVISFPSEIERTDDDNIDNELDDEKGKEEQPVEPNIIDESKYFDPSASANNNSSKNTPEGQENSQQNTNNINWASPDSKYEKYTCRVDRHQGDRASEITLFVLKRPHMRAFHFAWFSFFVGFFLWFAISPLLKEIQDSLGLTTTEIWISNTYSSAGTIFFRLLAGPLCDTYGARLTMAMTLILSALPVMAIGLVHNSTELYIVRLLSGISGSSFVICQYWTSSMFVREIAGTANSLASGWGNLGGGVAQIVMGSALFPLFKIFYGKEHADFAWRTIFILPAIFGIITAFCVMKYSDDTPKGNYRKLQRLGTAPDVKIFKSFRSAVMNFNTWVLLVQYGCCFGVEVTMTTGAAFYFSDVFDQTTESAAALASIFGWLNIFARGLGGFISDIMNVKFGMRGRLIWQMLSLVFEGLFIILFSYSKTLGGAIAAMVAFSLFVQTSEGSTYSIVPYVCPSATGSVAGIIGSGGNVGGVIYLYLVTKLEYENAFRYMGLSVVCSSLLSFFINIPGQSRGLRRLNEEANTTHEQEGNDEEVKDTDVKKNRRESKTYDTDG